MKKFYLMFLGLWMILFHVQAQEKLLYATDFSDWQALTSTSETEVAKKTDFSNEDLKFKFFQVTVNPTGRDETRFDYTLVNSGWAITEKNFDSYIITSPLKSITKVIFTHGATGSNRGYKLWKKGPSDADWVAVSSAVANPSKGHVITANINEENVALKFTNLNLPQNAYMFDLKIYGNFVSTSTQYDFTTSQNIAEAGSITRTPNSDKYDAGTNVSLLATKNFGYKFVKWVDGNSNADLSTQNPYVVKVDAAKNIKAIFEAITTYNFEVKIAGSNWGQVSLSPAPTGGKYEAGTEVHLKVVPNEVTAFSFWNDNSTVAEKVVTVNSNQSFTATFDEIPFIVGWDFRNTAILANRAGDYYSETTNTGLISAYGPDNKPVNWLGTAPQFSPAYPHLRLWTPATDFVGARRYLKAQFSTEGYKNIQLKSLVSANYQTYAVHILQYSLDDVTYHELARVDITSNYNATWAPLNATLPAEAEGKSRVYIRWAIDPASARLGNAADVDGTAYTNIFAFADKEAVNDTKAPTLVSHIPVANSATATVNGSVVLTFDERVKAGTGNITLDGKSLSATYGSKTATFAYEKLQYNTEYTFTVPAGAITDIAGNPFAGVTFKFKTANRTEPAKKLFDAVVAQDGSGDYLSVIDAITAAPVNRTQPWLIYIKAGKYTGHHDIPTNKPFIHLIGQHVDSVIISDNRLSGGDNAVHVSVGATMVVNSTDCYFEHITFENSFGHEQQTGPQALALYTLKDRFTMNKSYLRSYQDTYLTSTSLNTRHYINKSRIQGAVDFIYGGGDVFFDKCDIICTRKDGGYIVAPSHNAGTKWGYVFHTNTISEAVASGVTTYFGRPWQNSPKTVFLNTTLKAKVYASGWYYKMGAIPAIFADYNTMDANGNPVDLSQRISDYEYDVKDGGGNVTSVVKGTAKSSLTAEEAASYSYENVVLLPGDTWDPRLMTEAPETPSNLAKNGNILTWNTVPYTRLYIVFKNKKPFAFTTVPTYTDAQNTNQDTYGIQAVGEYGALSEIVTLDIVAPVTGINLVATEKNGDVTLNWKTVTESNTATFTVEHSINNATFTAIGKLAAAGNSTVIRHYSFSHQNAGTGTHLYRIKITDLDGLVTYSPVATVKISDDARLVVSPTVTASALVVSYPKAVSNSTLTIINTAGQPLKNIKVPNGSLRQTLNVSTLPSGVYIVEYNNGGQKIQTRFIKQ
ncbi:pectinesterase family protein [Polluticaenibacter yanchengensis]|uniref:Pectinesterase family protein n=1 Tax=Polluticaenibacter yanchengensis TaxID=3014562 RepID=A0ABT4UK07_9BACT|nr:pectinesterase family protein [Chitinophagaceae bacterium LY-5]